MELEKYADVHPNWHLIEDLSEDEARATLELLLTAVYLDGELTERELTALAETWSRLPFVGPELDQSTMETLLEDTRQRLDQILDTPEHFDDFVAEATAKIRDDERQIAVLRLLAIVLTEDGTRESEQALLYAVGYHFDLEYDTVDDVIRSVWESHEESEVSSPGKRRKKPLLKGKHWAEQRPSQPYANPFTTPLN